MPGTALASGLAPVRLCRAARPAAVPGSFKCSAALLRLRAPRLQHSLAPQQRRKAAPVAAAAVAAAAPLAAAAALLSPAVVFDAATLLVMPFYALMVAAPGSRLTHRLLGGRALFTVAALLYALLLLLWQPLPQLAGVAAGAAQAVTAAAQAGSPAAALRLAQPSMAAFAALFGRPEITALAWVNLVLLDLWQARWVYQDARRYTIPCWHSAVLCFMVGPLGLLCHLATKAGLRWWRRRGVSQEGDYTVYRF